MLNFTYTRDPEWIDDINKFIQIILVHPDIRMLKNSKEYIVEKQRLEAILKEHKQLKPETRDLLEQYLKL